MDAVLRVDLQPLSAARGIVHDLINAGRTIALFRRIIDSIIDRDRFFGIAQPEVRRLVKVMDDAVVEQAAVRVVHPAVADAPVEVPAAEAAVVAAAAVRLRRRAA